MVIIYSIVIFLVIFLVIWRNHDSDYNLYDYFENEYPINKKSLDYYSDNFGKLRDEITNLIITSKIKGKKLELCGFKNLINLKCSNNELEEIILPKNNLIEKIIMNDSNLYFFSYNLLSSNLVELNISNNNLTGCISIFNKLINLENFYFHDNNFHGSLNLLNKLKNLKSITFHNNPIVPSLEILSGESLRFLSLRYCFIRLNYKKSKNLIYNNLSLSSYLFLTNSNNFKILNFLPSIKDLSSFEDCYISMKRNLNLAFQNSKTSILTDNFLNNENNGFLLWLDDRMSSIKKLKMNLYWELILSNKKSELLFSDNEILEKNEFSRFYYKHYN